MKPVRSQEVIKIVAIAVVYFLTAKFGLSLAYGTAQVTTVWPPAGIALACVLVFGNWCWPGILIGAFFANVTTNEPILVAAMIAIGNTLESTIAGAWLRRVKFQATFNHVRDVWIFIGVVLAVALIASLIGVSSLAYGKEIAWSAFRTTDRIWYLGDLMGMMIVTPVILLAIRQRYFNPFRRIYKNQYILFGVVILSQLLTYFRSYRASDLITPRAYQAFPLVIWAALKTSPFGVAVINLIICMVAILGTTHGRGPFTTQPTIEGNLISLQSFLFYVVATGLTLGAIVSERDVVRKNLEVEKDQLLQTKARVEGMVLSIGEGLVVVDTTGTIVLVNPIFQELTGWSSKQVIGKSIQEVLPLETEDRNPIPVEDRLTSRVLQHGKTIVTGLTAHPHYYVSRTGRRFPVAVSVSPVRVNGKIVGAVNVFRDITSEFEVDRAKDEFVALASHQLRTPLSSIRWYTEMLSNQEVGPINRKQQEYLKQIYSGNLRMIDLVNALLNVSRVELGKLSVEPRPTSLSKLLDIVLKELRANLKNRKLRLVKQYSADIPELPLDPQLMTMVIQNLLSNAIKYTPEKGTITVSLRWDRAHARSPKSRRVVLSIQDSGFGIPENQQKMIFTKMFRADNVRKQETTGTGLGLYIAKAIIEQSGGKIWFTSTEQKGTTFFVSLPLSGMKRRVGSRGLAMS